MTRKCNLCFSSLAGLGTLMGDAKSWNRISFLKKIHSAKASYCCTCHFPGALFWEVTLRHLWRDNTTGQYLAKTNSFLLCMHCEFFNVKNGCMFKSWLSSLMITELGFSGNLEEWKSWDWVFFFTWSLQTCKNRTTHSFPLFSSCYF